MHKQRKSGPGTAAVSFEEQFSNGYNMGAGLLPLCYITQRPFRCPAWWHYHRDGSISISNRRPTHGITVNYKHDVRMSSFQCTYIAVLQVLLHGRRAAATLLHHVAAFAVPGLMVLTSQWLYQYIEPYTWYHYQLQAWHVRMFVVVST